MSNKGQVNFMLPRADFRAQDFDTLITQKGYKVIWEQGMFCSCYINSGQPDYNCPTCDGKGYVYFDATETRALITSISGNKKEEHIGLDEKGAAYLTPLSTDNVGFRDKFTFQDFTMKYSEVIMRNGRESEDPDKLRYPSLKLECLRDVNTVYKEGVDFSIPKDGRTINWLIDNPPEQYSILYNTKPVYIAISPIHELRGTYSLYKGGGQEYFVPLPKQFKIKREDFITLDDL